MGTDSITEVIGSTPLVRLHPRKGDRLTVWAKLEGANPAGSAKDRVAIALIDDALASGRLRPGGRIIESSSGNFGTGMAMIAAARGLRFTCVVDPRTNASTVAMMRTLGADVVEITDPDEQTGDWLIARINRVRELCAADPSAVWLDQYSNPAAVAAHRDGTMREIADALADRVDWLFVATSTTGTIGGCQALIRQRGLATRLVAVDAEGSVLFGGVRGRRRLPGYGAGIIPALAAGVEPDEVIRVAEPAAVAASRALARAEGVFVGGSAGAVAAAFRSRQDAIPSGAQVVLICHDGGAGYLDTVYSDDWVAETLGIDADEMARLTKEAW